MRIRTLVLVTLVSLAVPLLAQEQKFVSTMQLSGGKAETISSFSWEVTNPAKTTTGEAGAGRAVSGSFTLTKPVSPLSRMLFEGCAAGTHFPTVVITMKDKKGTTYYEVKLTDVIVSSYRLSGTGDGSTESISLTYSDIEYTLLGQ